MDSETDMNRDTDRYALTSPPLIEAWLELRWRLEETRSMPPMMRDPGYQYALGPFFSSIKGLFPHKEELDANQAPLDIFPHVVRHRFRAEPNGWPMVQIGPGVVSLNFSEPYDWKTFRTRARFVVDRLLDAYVDYPFEPELAALRYRNAEPFEYTKGNLFDFLQDRLNTAISIPEEIPGQSSSRDSPSSVNIVVTYDLNTPKGSGTIRYATGSRKGAVQLSGASTVSEVLMFQIEVASSGQDCPDFTAGEEFVSWLESAHSIAHGWFFSLIEGPLLDKYGE